MSMSDDEMRTIEREIDESEAIIKSGDTLHARGKRPKMRNAMRRKYTES